LGFGGYLDEERLVGAQIDGQRDNMVGFSLVKSSFVVSLSITVVLMADMVSAEIGFGLCAVAGEMECDNHSTKTRLLVFHLFGVCALWM
jgi:hypothetical protein